jgi:hypothetical protein
MKKLKLLVIATMMVGLWSGSASAMVVDVDDVFTISGDQGDGYGGSLPVASTDVGGIPFQDWIGIIVSPFLPQGDKIRFTASGGQTSIATPSLNLRLWDAVKVGDNWATVGAALYTQVPAGNFTPMIGSLMEGGTYLMEFFGNVEFANCPPALACGDPQTALYSMSMSSNNVPVPAAIWLFGTAMVGFLGLRRKQKFSAVAA